MPLLLPCDCKLSKPKMSSKPSVRPAKLSGSKAACGDASASGEAEAGCGETEAEAEAPTAAVCAPAAASALMLALMRATTAAKRRS